MVPEPNSPVKRLSPMSLLAVAADRNRSALDRRHRNDPYYGRAENRYFNLTITFSVWLMHGRISPCILSGKSATAPRTSGTLPPLIPCLDAG